MVELCNKLMERFGYGSVTPYPEDSMDAANLTADRTPELLHARYSDLNGHVCGDVMLFEVRVTLFIPMVGPLCSCRKTSWALGCILVHHGTALSDILCH